MEQISIVKKRSRLWPMLFIILIVLALIVLGAMYFVGDAPPAAL